MSVPFPTAFVTGARRTPVLVAKAIVEVAADPGSEPEYVVSGAGLRAVG